MIHIVGFSGGADSQACAGWVLDHFLRDKVILCNSDAGGNEHPMTTEHVRWYSEHVHPVVMIQARVSDLADVGTRCVATGERRRELGEDSPLTFDRLAYVKGIFPSRKRQFCTEYLKLRPQQRWIRENAELLNEGYTRYSGVRADESEGRRELPETEWDDFFDCELVRPLISWTKARVFDFLAARGEQVNQLYRLGFGRVGCAPCVNSNKEDVLNWATRFPEMIDKVRAWEQSVGRTFFAPIVPGMRINWVDDVIAWSKTMHGGKKLALPFFEAEARSGACVSKYGLCE